MDRNIPMTTSVGLAGQSCATFESAHIDRRALCRLSGLRARGALGRAGPIPCSFERQQAVLELRGCVRVAGTLAAIGTLQKSPEKNDPGNGPYD
jgi:hypothetical protein